MTTMAVHAINEMIPGRGSILSGMGDEQLPSTRHMDTHVVPCRL